MKQRLALVLAVLIGCEAFPLAPIELDVSSNCNLVEVITIADRVEAPERPWKTIVAAAIDQPDAAGGWLLVVRAPAGGIDQLALVHVDDELQIDHDVAIDSPPGLADQFEIIPGLEPGGIYVTQRAPGTFYVREYDLLNPLVASSPNLATIAAPCDPDGDGVYQSCDASSWFQDLVFLNQEPFALTFPPASNDHSIEVTPTPLDDFLSPAFPLDDERTVDFIPSCNQNLPLDELESCEAHLLELSYPTLESAGLSRDSRRQFAVLAMYREVKSGDEQATVADAPLFFFIMADLDDPTGLLLVNPVLPEPRNAGPRGVAIDPNSSYFHYTAIDGEPVLARAGHNSGEIDRMDRDLDFPEGAELLQLDDDIALHRIVDDEWEILKLFPDAPERSKVTRVVADAPIERVTPAGSSAFVVHRADGVADLVQVRCVLETVP